MIVPCLTPAEAVKEADLILCATNCSDVLVNAADVAPGSTILALNGFKDLDPALRLRADKWVLGYTGEDKVNIIDMPEVMSHGQVTSLDEVYGDLTEIIQGSKSGREREDEIILYSHMGMGAFDVFCAYKAYLRAQEEGIGVIVDA